MNTRKKGTLLVVLVIALFSIIYSNNLIIDKAYADEEGKGSTIGGIAVDGLSNEEIRNALNDAIVQWTSEPLIVTGGGSTIEINASTFQYDVDTTIATYKSLVKKEWYKFWKTKDAVHIPIEIVLNDSIKEEISNIVIWDTDSTYDKVKMHASYLGSHEIEADITNLTLLENERIALVIEEIPSKAMGVEEIVDVLNNQILNPQQRFSFLETIGEQADLANREALNFVASILYSIALHTNSDILERTSQNVVPTYLEAGIEAAVERDGSKDLQFINQTSNAIKLKFSIEGDNLKAEAYSTNKEQDIEVRVIREQEVEPRSIIRYSNELNIGEEQVVAVGTPGLRVSVVRYFSSTGEEELISKDYYAPQNRIILKSSRQSISGSLPNVDENENGETIDMETQEEFVTESGEVVELPEDEEQLPEGSYYDKGGNLITP